MPDPNPTLSAIYHGNNNEVILPLQPALRVESRAQPQKMKKKASVVMATAMLKNCQSGSRPLFERGRLVVSILELAR